ncbi:hypothetical protein [Stenotrophomonas sp. BIGb0135]|uniref:hypothetical protein n=1 Tax=Stenotrophomonas sp. BIGb0135 TaxID=2940620 RepID=UPI0021694045|nr:hypothetical protein [Stenotrophomonas sp. BIGb0135]MCS4236027.1 hypothetical protein [Stenotrophomonas sp. BIGb0135]
MSELDYRAFYRLLAAEVRASTDVGQSMRTLLAWGDQRSPHPSWAVLKELDCSVESAGVGKWLTRVLRRAPCPFPVRAIYFGLGERATRDGVEFADLYFGLLGHYEPADKACEWLWRNPRHYPDKAYLGSATLKAAGVICNEDEVTGLGTPGHIVFALSFATLLLRASLDGSIYQLLGAVEPVGVVVGFDSGDLFRLGELHSDGFRPTKGAMT